jgi:hypothetical protein
MRQARLITKRSANRRPEAAMFLRGPNRHGGVVRPMSGTSPDRRTATQRAQAVLEAPERFKEGRHRRARDKRRSMVMLRGACCDRTLERAVGVQADGGHICCSSGPHGCYQMSGPSAAVPPRGAAEQATSARRPGNDINTALASRRGCVHHSRVLPPWPRCHRNILTCAADGPSATVTVLPVACASAQIAPVHPSRIPGGRSII